MTHAIRTRGRAMLVGAALCSVFLATAALASTSSGATVKAPRITGVSAHQIILGTTQPLSGPAAPGYSEIGPAINAVFQYMNALGGVYGRKIKYLIEDDQYYPPLTIQKTRQLVEQDGIFADIAPLGTAPQLAVQPYLNKMSVPQLFIASGCACWSQAKYPDSFGWQPNYIVEGKILGKYVASHLAGKKVGYLSQDDEFGRDGVQGLNQEIPAKSVVDEEKYEVANLATSGVSNQISALKAKGAQVVVLYSIPGATALALGAAAKLGYFPQWVVSSVGADPATLAGLLGKSGAPLLNGMITNAYLPPETKASDAWVKLSKAILAKYEGKGYPWDGNSEYGVAVGITTVELLKAAGKNLTHANLIHALETEGPMLPSPGLVPLTYTQTNHYGYSGSEVVRVTNSGASITPVTPVYVTTIHGAIKTYTRGEMKIPPLFNKA